MEENKKTEIITDEKSNKNIDQIETQEILEKENKKCKSNKIFTIVIVIIAILLVFGCGMILGNKLGSNKNESEIIDSKENNIIDNKEKSNKEESKENNIIDNNENNSYDLKFDMDEKLIDKNINIYYVISKESDNKNEKNIKKLDKHAMTEIYEKLSQNIMVRVSDNNYDVEYEKDTITILIGEDNNLENALMKLEYYGNNSLLLRYNGHVYIIVYNYTSGFFESLLDTYGDYKKVEVASKISEIGFSTDRAHYDIKDNLFYVCGGFWFNKNKFSADDLSKKQLINTAINNINLAKASIFDGRYIGIYSLEEFNEALNKVIYGKSITLDDIKNNWNESYEKLEINDNKIKLVYPNEKECWTGPYTYGHIENIVENNNEVDILLKVAFCERDDTEDPMSKDESCYKDANKKTLIDKYNDYVDVKDRKWDKYNTYKVIFKLINGNYYFDSYELVK